MANYNELKAAIQQVIRTNGNNEITGALLQQSLISMIDSLGSGYAYVGAAIPTTVPPITDSKIFYLASTPGTYTAFGSLVLNEGEIGILKFDSVWSLDAMPVGAGITILDVKINEANTIVEVSNQSVFEKWALESPLKLVHIYDEESDSGYYVLPDIFIIDPNSWEGEPDVSSVVKSFVFIPDRKLYLKIWSATEDWGEEGCEIVNSATGYFIDAPHDSIPHVRKNGEWVKSPVEISGGEKSLVKAGSNNVALSPDSVVLGSNSVAGVKGYYVISVGTNYLYLSDTRESAHQTGSPIRDITIDYNLGDIITVSCDNKTIGNYEIVRIIGNDVRVNGDVELFDEIEDEYIKVFCPSKPEVGPCVLSSGAISLSSENRALGRFSFASGHKSQATGLCAHAVGASVIAEGNYSHAEGQASGAGGTGAHAEGVFTTARGVGSHAEGHRTAASELDSDKQDSSGSTSDGDYAHAEGSSTFAKGNASHAEGVKTQTTGRGSHAEGALTLASGKYAHAEGYETKAAGTYSHAEGNGTETQNVAEFAGGNYNLSVKDSPTFGAKRNTIFSVGVGRKNSRKNAIQINQNGEIYIMGVKGYNGSNAQYKVNSVQKALEDIGVPIDWTILDY